MNRGELAVLCGQLRLISYRLAQAKKAESKEKAISYTDAEALIDTAACVLEELKDKAERTV